ncbi:unnamed protein product [Penicillium salamii]|nr:unnamed protein product [Penicillium salamii]
MSDSDSSLSPPPSLMEAANPITVESQGPPHGTSPLEGPVTAQTPVGLDSFRDLNIDPLQRGDAPRRVASPTPALLDALTDLRIDPNSQEEEKVSEITTFAPRRTALSSCAAYDNEDPQVLGEFRYRLREVKEMYEGFEKAFKEGRYSNEHALHQLRLVELFWSTLFEFVHEKKLRIQNDLVFHVDKVNDGISWCSRELDQRAEEKAVDEFLPSLEGLSVSKEVEAGHGLEELADASSDSAASEISLEEESPAPEVIYRSIEDEADYGMARREASASAEDYPQRLESSVDDGSSVYDSSSMEDEPVSPRVKSEPLSEDDEVYTLRALEEENPRDLVIDPSSRGSPATEEIRLSSPDASEPPVSPSPEERPRRTVAPQMPCVELELVGDSSSMESPEAVMGDNFPMEPAQVDLAYWPEIEMTGTLTSPSEADQHPAGRNFCSLASLQRQQQRLRQVLHNERMEIPDLLNRRKDVVWAAVMSYRQRSAVREGKTVFELWGRLSNPKHDTSNSLTIQPPSEMDIDTKIGFKHRCDSLEESLGGSPKRQRTLGTEGDSNVLTTSSVLGVLQNTSSPTAVYLGDSREQVPVAAVEGLKPVGGEWNIESVADEPALIEPPADEYPVEDEVSEEPVADWPLVGLVTAGEDSSESQVPEAPAGNSLRDTWLSSGPLPLIPYLEPEWGSTHAWRFYHQERMRNPVNFWFVSSDYSPEEDSGEVFAESKSTKVEVDAGSKVGPELEPQTEEVESAPSEQVSAEDSSSEAPVSSKVGQTMPGSYPVSSLEELLLPRVREAEEEANIVSCGLGDFPELTVGPPPSEEHASPSTPSPVVEEVHQPPVVEVEAVEMCPDEQLLANRVGRRRAGPSRLELLLANCPPSKNGAGEEPLDEVSLVDEASSDDEASFVSASSTPSRAGERKGKVAASAEADQEEDGSVAILERFVERNPRSFDPGVLQPVRRTTGTGFEVRIREYAERHPRERVVSDRGFVSWAGLPIPCPAEEANSEDKDQENQDQRTMLDASSVVVIGTSIEGEDRSMEAVSDETGCCDPVDPNTQSAEEPNDKEGMVASPAGFGQLVSSGCPLLSKVNAAVWSGARLMGTSLCYGLGTFSRLFAYLVWIMTLCCLAFVLFGGHISMTGILNMAACGPGYVFEQLRTGHGTQDPLMDGVFKVVVRWLTDNWMTPG